jgi:phosphatidylserine decarboxylase
LLAPGAARWLGPDIAVLVAAAAVVDITNGWVELAALLVSAVAAGLLVFLFVFFRDPERPVGDGIVSAADGTVRAVERVGDRWNVSVFLGPTDVHVNRCPLEGTVEAVESSGRGHRPAYRPDADRNAQRRYRLRTAIGPVDVVQIVGIVARRLVAYVGPGAAVAKGERLGMIVLGSRVDVLVPADRATPTVTVGERVWAGESTIARVGP